MEKSIKYILGIVTLVIIVCLVFVMSWFATELLPTSSTVLELQHKIEPFEPYDIAKLDYVLEQNDDYWIVVVKYIDIDTNSTVYIEYNYNLETKNLTEVN